VRRDDRKIGECPLASLDLELFGDGDCEQMTDCGRDDVIVVLEVVFVFLKLAKRLADVAGDGRFLRNNEGFAHVTWFFYSQIGAECNKRFLPGGKSEDKK
jgi:hypothetical protein